MEQSSPCTEMYRRKITYGLSQFFINSSKTCPQYYISGVWDTEGYRVLEA
jgi:hypothetical protein